MKNYEGVTVQLPPFVTWALDGGEWSASTPSRFSPVERIPLPLDGRLGGPQSQSERCEEKSLAPAENRTHVAHFIG
jgi:hypothetical protein